MISIRSYISLIKPRMILANSVTIIGGFFLASKGHVDWSLFGVTLGGMALIMASGCVFNNYIDRDIDKMMERTRNRVLPTGKVSETSAIIYGICLGLLGIFVLVLYTNLLAVAAALTGIFVYVVLYSWFKRQSTLGTVIGSISGAVPPVVGYCAVTNNFDSGAVILFAILVLWQMPHFFAISIYRFDDYVSASVPVLPVKKGIYIAKIQILLYIIGFIFGVSTLTMFGYAGNFYLAVVGSFSLTWLGLSIKGFWAKNDKLWARRMFLLSLVVLMLFSFMISIDFIS